MRLIFIIRSPLEIEITSPSGGETINKERIMVKGTIKSDTRDIGIRVNGILADVNGNKWIANNVPLTVGANAITAVATDSYGNTDTTTITVYTNDITQNAKLSANITSGIAPLQVYFTASTSSTPTSYQMDFEGDGIIDYTGPAFEDISFTYNSEGIYYPTISVTDDQGNTYSDTFAITVISKTEIDTLLKGKWEGMKGALTTANVERALEMFVESSREMYRYNFNLLSSILPIITKDLGNVRLMNITDDVAEYEMPAIQDGIEYSFYIQFVKDSDGIWKLRFF